MALKNNDLLIVERGGVQYQLQASELSEFLGIINDISVVDINERNGLSELKVGDRVFVGDATTDTTVKSGWAIYRVTTTDPINYTKIQEQESMDITITANTNLSITRDAASVTIESDTGTNAVIPLVDADNAGMASPDMFKNSHKPAKSGLTSQTNPVIINEKTQEVTFKIEGLQPLP